MACRETNWYLITGTTSSGKTTLCEGLTRRGRLVTPEVTRLLFSTFLDQDVPRERLESNDETVRGLILEHVVQLHRDLIEESDTPIFFDRGLIDQFAFFGVSGIADVSAIARESSAIAYKRVFVLEPLPFEPDGVRTEDPDRRQRIQDLILRYSRALGYEPVMVPALGPEERVNFVLNETGAAGGASANPRVAEAVASLRRSITRLDPEIALGG